MPKTYVNLSYDRRGWPELYKHVVEQLQNGGFNPGSLELNFNGNPIQSKDDITFLKKIIPLFEDARSIWLRKCKLQTISLDWLGEVLCSKNPRCKRIDLAANAFDEKALAHFINILEGRSITKVVTPFWLAIGDGAGEALLTPTPNCDPYSPTGCKCRARRMVHVVRTLISKPFKDALAKAPPQWYPPPPPNGPQFVPVYPSN